MVTRSVIRAGVWLLEAIFAFGMVGSALVVILAGVEDVREIFKQDEPRTDGAE